ncbi:hypothetical protein AB0M36_15660 [Actinoplanes sp. NPDC051346]|uniref:hypothetical protein n=1 Tax=Actinoplanes sp. NPDC051346 TaxID=3155048 RepID=UPI0034419B62
MKQYFAVVGAGHDAKDPLTLVRVSESGLVQELSEHAAWVPAKLVERIEAGEVPYRLVPVTEKAAARIRKQREKKVAYRYSIFVWAADPTNTAIGVLREWDANGTTSGEIYRIDDGEWALDPIRIDVERGATDFYRIMDSDASTVNLWIEAARRRS